MYKHGHHDRDCCDAHQFPVGQIMRSRTLRDSLVYGTRVVRHTGLKVDDSLRLAEYKGHSRPIRDSIVYGTREKRCRHKQCTAWHHFHEYNEELEKWDFPDQISTEEKRALWLASRKSVLDDADIRRKTIPRNRWGELETDGGHYAGEFLRTVLKPWDYGNHPHDMYRSTRPSLLADLSFEDLRGHYDSRPEAIKFHHQKLQEVEEWQRVQLLDKDMKWKLLQVQGIRRMRLHFQHLRERLKKSKVLWSELNRNSVWFVPWPEGDHAPELVRRSLMMISKRLSSCASLWHPNFTDLKTLNNYLNNLEDLAPQVWDQFHYKCKLHKHLDQHQTRATRLESIRRASLPPLPEPPIQLPLCEPVSALHKQMAARPADLQPRPQPTPDHPSACGALGGQKPLALEQKPHKLSRYQSKNEKSRAYALLEIKELDNFDGKLEAGLPQKDSKGVKGAHNGKSKDGLGKNAVQNVVTRHKPKKR